MTDEYAAAVAALADDRVRLEALEDDLRRFDLTGEARRMIEAIAALDALTRRQLAGIRAGLRSYAAGLPVPSDPMLDVETVRAHHELAAARAAAEAAVEGARAAGARRRGPGRPAWTPQLFHQRWREALARGRLPADASYPDVARYFQALAGDVGEILPESLGKLARHHGRPE